MNHSLKDLVTIKALKIFMLVVLRVKNSSISMEEFL
jgi:hypothetical protein